jgi:hypothetical protein
MASEIKIDVRPVAKVIIKGYRIDYHKSPITCPDSWESKFALQICFWVLTWTLYGVPCCIYDERF